VHGPAERFAALAGPALAIGGSQEPPAFRIEPVPGRPGRFTASGPALGGPGTVLAFAACRVGGAELAVAAGGETLVLADPTALPAAPRSHGHREAGPVLAPMAGRILEVHAAAGDRVEPGQLLFVLESMKMQFEVSAPRAGRLEAVLVAPGQVLQGPEPLALLEG
jgi:biotin carboxyl carrier protein